MLLSLPTFQALVVQAFHLAQSSRTIARDPLRGREVRLQKNLKMLGFETFLAPNAPFYKILRDLGNLRYAEVWFDSFKR